MSNKVVPYDTILEKKLLAGVLNFPLELPDVITIVGSRDFYNNNHRRAFDAVLGVFDAGKEVGYETVSHQLGLNGDGIWFDEIFTFEHSKTELPTLAKLIKELSVRRQMVESLDQIKPQLLNTSTDVFSILNEIDKRVMELSGVVKTKKPTLLGNLLPAFNERLSEIQNGKREFWGTASGFTAIDNLLGGFSPGNLYVLAGRPT